MVEAKIAAMASFAFIGAAVAVVVSGGDVGGGVGSRDGGGNNGVRWGEVSQALQGLSGPTCMSI